jgi:hypothetical protein
MLLSFVFLQFYIASTYAHIFMNDPPSRRNKYSKEYVAQGNVDYNIMAPLYHDGSTFPFPCKGFPKGPSTKTINGNIVNIKLEGSATHGGGHCQFGVTYDDSTFVVLKTVTDNCLTSGMNYNFDLPSNIPSGDITVFWTWINRIGNREYYMECADITINNPNSNNLPVEIKGKELLVVNILGKTIIPEGLPVGNDGIDLLNARKDISIVSGTGGNSGSPPPSQQQPSQQQPSQQQVSTIGTYYFRVSDDKPGCPPVQTFNDGQVYGPCSVQYGSQSKYWVAIKNGGQYCGEKIRAYSGSNSIMLIVMDECPGCGSDNHLDMSLDALIELTGSVESACAINTVQPRLIWSFSGRDTLVESKPTFIDTSTSMSTSRRTRKITISSPTYTRTQLPKSTHTYTQLLKSTRVSIPSEIDVEYQEYLEFKNNYEKECEENK